MSAKFSLRILECKYKLFLFKLRDVLRTCVQLHYPVTRTRFSIREDKVSGMAPKYVLIYFDVRGRAEPTRLLFKAAGVEFEDRRFSFEEWGKEKEQLKSGEAS